VRYIAALHELQDNEELHLGNKLRKGHTEYYNIKIKVRFAVQASSSSVANTLQMCRNVLHLENFEQTKATEEFLHMINDSFDIFNSRNTKIL